jgi:SAM-dependent methyltransferase
MKLSNSLYKRSCPVCNSTDDTQIIFKKCLKESALNNLAFSSRKIPEFMNLTLVCCPACNLLYVPSVPTKTFLQTAYHATGYDSDEEACFAAETYATYLQSIISSLPDRRAALEIGAGNGAFLQKLLIAGFKEVIGVEPSIEAISAAPLHIKKCIHTGMFDVNDFPAGHFSLIAIFQTLEHIDQPAQFFRDAFALLKPGGVLITVAHNYRHWLMRLLGKKSPIIDIEHLQLFSPASLRYVLEKTEFQKIQIHSLYNTYPLHYWTKLLPIPKSLKHRLLNFFKKNRGQKIGSLKITASVGNMVAWAQK